VKIFHKFNIGPWSGGGERFDATEADFRIAEEAARGRQVAAEVHVHVEPGLLETVCERCKESFFSQFHQGFHKHFER
jgi:hypothetical protein